MTTEQFSVITHILCFQMKLLGCDRVVKKSNMNGARFLVSLFVSL